jgi:membrane-associated phospholipid phosphatase
VALILQDWPDRTRRWRGTLLLAAPAIGGIVCELLKLLLRRERPSAHEGAHVFRDFSERTFSTGGLALPSSHVMVAFSAAAILAYMFPRARAVWFVLATGCALTRVLARAHFVSDVVLAALCGILVATLLWRWYERRFAARPA